MVLPAVILFISVVHIVDELLDDKLVIVFRLGEPERSMRVGDSVKYSFLQFSNVDVLVG
jgi:hypothetical protein